MTVDVDHSATGCIWFCSQFILDVDGCPQLELPCCEVEDAIRDRLHGLVAREDGSPRPWMKVQKLQDRWEHRCLSFVHHACGGSMTRKNWRCMLCMLSSWIVVSLSGRWMDNSAGAVVNNNNQPRTRGPLYYSVRNDKNERRKMAININSRMQLFILM